MSSRNTTHKRLFGLMLTPVAQHYRPPGVQTNHFSGAGNVCSSASPPFFLAFYFWWFPKVLEGTPEGASAAAYLRKAFSAMVAMQLEAADEAGGRPRFVDRKGRTANRNSTPPRKKQEEKEDT